MLTTAQNPIPPISELIDQQSTLRFIAQIEIEYPNKKELDALTSVAEVVQSIADNYPWIPVREIFAKTGIISEDMVPNQFLVDLDTIVESRDVFGIDNWDPAEKIQYFITYKGFLILDSLIRDLLDMFPQPMTEKTVPLNTASNK